MVTLFRNFTIIARHLVSLHQPAAVMWIPYHRRPSFASYKKTSKHASNEGVESNFLHDPRTEKLQCKNIVLNSMEIGHASMQGYRVSMEDEFIIDAMGSLPDHTFVAILDGLSYSYIQF